MNEVPARGIAVRYAVVGVLGTAIHFGFLAALVELGGVDAVVASGAGFIAALIASYVLNHRWTFRSVRDHRTAFLRYAMVCGLGITVNSLIMHVSVHIFGLWYILGQTLVVVVVPPLNFVLSRAWAFRGASLTSPPAA
jgi:putative flippase GtrA